MIKEVPINDNWLYRKGFNAQCLEQSFDWSDGFIVQLPHCVHCGETSYFDEREMRTLSTYARILTVPETYNGKKLLLRIEGALSYVEVYVNGIFVTSHKGEAPFEADITAPVKYDHENRIVLKVDSHVRAEIPSAGTRGPLLQFGGICRDVSFLICDGRDIRDITVRTSGTGENRTLTADAELFDYYPDTELDGEILDANGKKAGSFATRLVQGASVRLKGEASGIAEWSPSSPALYTAVVRLKSGKKILDCKRVTFGFASAVFKKDAFYLNGKPIKLIGLLRSDGYPVIGRSATEETERRDARLIKGMGCNAVRTMGQASRAFIDECNRIGLMVIEDVFGDGGIGGSDWRDAYVNGIADMVCRDRNSPAVIGWGVRAHNSADCDELYFKAAKAAKEADPTRATVGARSFLASRMYEDVFAYNEPDRRRGKRKSGKLFVPFLIGAHGGNSASSPYDGENVRLRQAFAHLDAINDVLGGAGVGAFGMSFCDFSTGRGRGNGDNRNRSGVCDGFRNPKTAAYAYMCGQDDRPVLELSGNLSDSDYTGALYAFTNADSVILYRNGEKAGEFFPDRKRWQNLPHPPIAIRDYAGDLPAADVGEGLRLKLFKSVLAECDRVGALNLGFWANKRMALLRMLTKKSAEELRVLCEKYARVPPDGVTYRIEGIFNGETKIVRTISPDIRRTLRITHSCESGVLTCERSYERIAFSLFSEDGMGNILDYDFMPVTVRASGSLSVEGSGHLCLEGGRGGFFVRSIAPGAGRVTVTSECGTQVFEFVCQYAENEKF